MQLTFKERLQENGQHEKLNYLLKDIRRQAEAISNGFKEKTKILEKLGETKMANKIWKKIKHYWGKILAYCCHPFVDCCGVCGNHKSKKKR